MNVTREIITDLLPVYYSDECSRDSKLLVEEFFRTNPEFERQARELRISFPSTIPNGLSKEDEMKSLGKTRRMLRLRSSIMGFAIFCTLAPFSFIYTQGKFYWLLSESPSSSVLYGVGAVALWLLYALLKRKTSDL